MFPKLSAIALCVSVALALKITIPVSSAQAGTSVNIQLVAANDDPAHVGLMLVSADQGTTTSLGGDVAVAPQVPVSIPMNVAPGQYSIEANQVGDEHNVIGGSNSNTFTVVAAPQAAGANPGVGL